MQQLECAACPVLVGFGSFDVRIPCLSLYPSFGRCRVAATEKQCLHEEQKGKQREGRSPRQSQQVTERPTSKQWREKLSAGRSRSHGTPARPFFTLFFLFSLYALAILFLVNMPFGFFSSDYSDQGTMDDGLYRAEAFTRGTRS